MIRGANGATRKASSPEPALGVRPARRTITLARTLSIVGHPALLMPTAVVWAASIHQAPAPVLHAAAAAAGFVVACVAVYSLVQVRAGRWQHVDASVPHERRQLNGFLALLLFGVALGLWWGGQPGPVVLGLALAGAVVVLASLLRRWLKLSLHAAFAVLAAALLWPAVLATLAVLALAAGVAWSRRVLQRHTRLEVVLGLLAGAAAGVGFHLALA